MKEIWKDIQGFEGYYQISNTGKIRNSKLHINKLRKNSREYFYVNLWKKSKSSCKTLHKLVISTFTPNLKNLPQINHKDGNKENNNVSNLEWCTARDNTIHAHKNHLCHPKHGEEHGLTTLTEDIVKSIRSEYIPRRVGSYQLAKKHSVCQTTILNIIKGRTWKFL